MMKPMTIIKSLFIVLLCLTVLLLTGCGESATPYETNDSEGYSVSVKFDANGGTFTTNTSVIVDTFNISELNKNDDNQAKVALISPDDKNRGNDAFTATKNGYFLAGWYKNRIENKDQNGDIVYSYSEKWDFDKDYLYLDTSREYTAQSPVLTLYAAWVPLFEVEYYSLNTGVLVDTYSFDPTEITQIKLPVWDEKTGAIEMYNFPKVDGCTYNGVYLDANKENVIEEDFAHPGTVSLETGTSEGSVLKLYVDYIEGEWYRIYTAEQLVESAALDGNYEILADLDFSNEIWPTTFMYGNFTGSIRGNGHTIKNVDFAQTNKSKVNAGLFGNITENVIISDLNFENISFTIKAGTRVVGTSFGLFAGTISDSATLNNVCIKNSNLLIDSSCYFGVDDYSIGLVCGMGDATKISDADINCSSVGENSQSVKISTKGNEVLVEISNE